MPFNLGFRNNIFRAPESCSFTLCRSCWNRLQYHLKSSQRNYSLYYKISFKRTSRLTVSSLTLIWLNNYRVCRIFWDAFIVVKPRREVQSYGTPCTNTMILDFLLYYFFQEKKLCDIEMLISYAIQSPNPSTTNEVALSTRLQKNSKFSLRAVLTLLLW